jgi:hypothetical protein
MEWMYVTLEYGANWEISSPLLCCLSHSSPLMSPFLVFLLQTTWLNRKLFFLTGCAFEQLHYNNHHPHPS